MKWPRFPPAKPGDDLSRMYGLTYTANGVTKKLVCPECDAMFWEKMEGYYRCGGCGQIMVQPNAKDGWARYQPPVDS